MLMPLTLDAELGWSQERSSSRAGESMLRSLSVPRILCAFGTWPTSWLSDLELLPSFSFVGVLDLRPGKGKENLEARPMALGEWWWAFAVRRAALSPSLF
jgi:hypothetical protein